MVAHELGHNLGDYHSRSKACDGASCSVSEYGDDADVMGNPTSGHMNAFQKERLGWLNYGDTPAILNVGQLRVRTGLTPTRRSTRRVPQPKALKVLKEVDGSGRRTWYYVESRTQIGLRWRRASRRDSAHRLGNERPRSLRDSTCADDLDDRLATRSGTDVRGSALGLRITTLWADATGAMIDVQFEAAPCTAVEPGLSVSPVGTVSTSAGTPVTYRRQREQPRRRVVRVVVVRHRGVGAVRVELVGEPGVGLRGGRRLGQRQRHRYAGGHGQRHE